MEKQLDTQEKEATEAISLWEASCSKLSEEKAQLEENLREHESSANEAIAQWEARCATLNQQIENLESQFDANQMDMTAAELQTKVTSLTSKLKLSQADTEKAQESLEDTKNSFAPKSREWEAKEASFISTIDELKELRTGQQKQSDEDKLSLDRIESQNITFQQERNDALKELEEFQGVVLEMKEDLQSFATDQFTIKATEMATQALRQETMEIRSQYKIDHEKLNDERETRCEAEEEVSRLKSELALLVQATEYNDDVAVHVRTIAKKVSAENMKAERKEMEELRTALERLKEELASSRWSNHESQEKAANARLQISILEQEVSAAKVDLQLSEEALEELENSKIENNVSLEYRIEALQNEKILTEQSYEDEINRVKGELSQLNQERDDLAHKLEQSEKANAALVYSTSHDGAGSDSEPEVMKLQLERAQLLAKINEMGADLERRVREAVAAQASFLRQ